MILLTAPAVSQTQFPDSLAHPDSIAGTDIRLYFYKPKILDVVKHGDVIGTLWILSFDSFKARYTHYYGIGYLKQEEARMPDEKIRALVTHFEKNNFNRFPDVIPQKKSYWPSGTLKIAYRKTQDAPLKIVRSKSPPMPVEQYKPFKKFCNFVYETIQ